MNLKKRQCIKNLKKPNQTNQRSTSFPSIMATSSSAQAFGWALPTSEQSYKKDKNDSPKPIANPLLKVARNYNNVTSFANGVQSPPQARAPFSQVDNTTLRRRKQSLESTKTIEPVFLPPKSSLLATGALYLELPETIIVSFKFFMDFLHFCFRKSAHGFFVLMHVEI